MSASGCSHLRGCTCGWQVKPPHLQHETHCHWVSFGGNRNTKRLCGTIQYYTICFDEDLRKDLHTASSELLKKWSKLKQNVQILSSYSLSMSKSGLSGKSWLSMTNSLSLLLRRWFLGFDLGCDWLRIHGRHRLWDCGKPFAVLPHGTCAQQLPSALWTFVISNGKIPP